MHITTSMSQLDIRNYYFETILFNIIQYVLFYVKQLNIFCFVGSYAGAIIGFPMAGFITHYIGWQYVYYVCGEYEYALCVNTSEC